jgi:hypothetical protein
VTSPADFRRPGSRADFVRYDGPVDLDAATEVVDRLRRGPLGFFGWRGRARALLRIPWREGEAVARQAGRRYLLEVRLTSGVELTVELTRKPRLDLVALGRLRVWAGGTGDRMTVLLGDVPAVVAAKKSG